MHISLPTDSLFPLLTHVSPRPLVFLSFPSMQNSDEDAIQVTCNKVAALDVNDNVQDKAEAEKPAAGDVTPAPADPVTADRSTTSGVVDKYSELGLRPEVTKLLSCFQLGDLTPEQEATIRSFTQTREPVTVMESGTERAVTFVVKAAMMQDLDPDTMEHQLLLLTPNRYAGLQVTRVVRALGEGHGLRARACIGGSPLHQDIRILRSGVQIVIGTTGRVIDLLERCILNTSYFKFFVLEDADEMLTTHKFQVYRILKKLPPDVRIVLLSCGHKWDDLVEQMRTVMAATPEEMEAHKSSYHSDGGRSSSRNGQNRDYQKRKRDRKRRHQSGGSSTDRTEEKATTPESPTTLTPDEADSVHVVAVQPEAPAVVAASA